VESQGWSATVCASCLLVGLGSSPAPGDRVSPGRVDAGAVKGRPKAERALMSAQRPLTAEAARWQPVQQANGRGRWVQGPAGQRSGEAVPRR
jgi:hypothetical protein